MIERNSKLPCGHEFVYADMILGKNIIKCTTCDWHKDIGVREPRKTDLTYKQFVERKKAE